MSGAAAERLARRIASDRLLRALAEEARRRPLEVYVVGGLLRDLLLGRRARDVDLIAGAGAPAVLAWLAARSSHRPVTFVQRVTNHRLTIDGRVVDLVERGGRTIDEELRRRDFTVNAIAWDLPRGRVLDPCGGVADLSRGRLRPPRADAFEHDPLRMLRAVRLAAEIPALVPDRATERRIAREADLIREAAPERVREELDRTLLAGRAGDGIAAADRLGLLEPWIPEIGAVRGLRQNRYHHLDVWTHTLEALAAADRPARLARGLLRRGWPHRRGSEPGPERPEPDEALLILRWALVLHDLGKAETRGLSPRGDVTFHGHELAGERIARDVTRRLVFPAERAAAVGRVVRLHLRLVVPPEGLLSRRALARIVRAAEPYVEVLALHALADQRASRGVGWRRTRTRLRETVRQLLELEREIDARRRRGRLLTGDDVLERLGLTPGPRVGEILREAERLRDVGELETREEALEWLEMRRPPPEEQAPRLRR